MTNGPTDIELCSECGEEIRDEICPRCSIGRVAPAIVGDEGKKGFGVAKKPKLPRLIAGTEILAGICYAVLAIWALVQNSSASIAVSIVFLLLSSLLILSGILLWRRHKVGWILSIVIQIFSAPQIELESFSWTIQTPIHFFMKFRRGDHYFGVDLLALFFAIALYIAWQRQPNSTTSEVASV